MKQTKERDKNRSQNSTFPRGFVFQRKRKLEKEISYF